jgi:hypothetical protein
MLNYKSVTNSEFQIRSNPALRTVSNSEGFQKRLSTLLEPTPLPFPTFQIAKQPSLSILEKHQHYAWVRPAHLRPQWLIIANDMPLLLVDPRDTNRINKLRIPFDTRLIQKIGPIVCEAAWDAQDHILWVWDVVVWEKQSIWSSVSYSQRWELVKQVATRVLQSNHHLSDADVQLPQWKSLDEISKITDLDPATSIEFQPEKPGQRRHLFLIRDDGVKFVPTTHAERKMVAEKEQTQRPFVSRNGPRNLPYIRAETNIVCGFIDEDSTSSTVTTPIASSPMPTPRLSKTAPSYKTQDPTPMPPNRPSNVETSFQDTQPSEKHLTGLLKKDVSSKLPDMYKLETVTGEDLGIPAIRSIQLSKQLREAFKGKEQVWVDIQWFEPFQKYDVRKVNM